MDRRALLAVSLSVAVLVIWQAFIVPRPRPVPVGAVGTTAPSGPRDTTAPGRQEATPAEVTSPPRAPVAESVAAEKRSEFIVETENYAVRFTNEGGRILSWRLLKYIDDLKAPLELVSKNASTEDEYPLRIVIPGDAASSRVLDRALFRQEVLEVKPTDDWPGSGFK